MVFGHLQNLTSRNGCLVNGKIEIGIDFKQLVVDGWSRICNTLNGEEGVMCEVYYGLLVGRCLVFDHEFVVVGECVGHQTVISPVKFSSR